MRRKRAPRWFAPLAVAFVAAAAVFVPRWFRDLGERLPMKIRELHVQGAKALSAIELKALAGIQEGAPLFGKWPAEVLAKVKQNPRVERVTLVRDVTGKIVMHVAERKAEALVNLDRLYFVDREGNVLEAADPTSAGVANLIVLTGPWKKEKRPEPRAQLAEGLALRDALLTAGFEEKRISELHFDSKLGWVVYRVNSKAPAIIGEGRFSEKAKRLARVLRDFKGKEQVVKEIDLDFRDRAIVKVKQAE